MKKPINKSLGQSCLANIAVLLAVIGAGGSICLLVASVNNTSRSFKGDYERRLIADHDSLGWTPSANYFYFSRTDKEGKKTWHIGRREGDRIIEVDSQPTDL